jgi:catechol 2,3-dioxygenase-like lactoylglutathione lyase family enzyme
MKKTLLAAAGCLALLVATTVPMTAQLMPPTSAGASVAAMHFTVPDVAKHKKIWMDNFGAKPTMVGKTEMLKIPGIFIVLTQGTPAAGTALVNHLGIWAKDLDPIRAKLTAAGIQTAPKAQFVDLPDGIRLEFIDDPAGPAEPAAQHIHYFIPAMPTAQEGRAWYMKEFGATENGRRNGAVPSALFTTPDKWVSIDFTGAGGRGGAAAPPASNKGKALDRFAIEVKGIDAFVKKLEGDGVKITKPVSTNADGIKTAMFVDLYGNDVELTEGLAGK